MRTAIKLLVAVLAAPAAFAQQADKKGCQGDVVFQRMPGTFVADCKASDFDRFPMHCGPRIGAPLKQVEGRHVMTRYEYAKSLEVPSRLAIVRNHQDAVKKIGGEVVFEDGRFSCLHVSKGGKDIWAEIDPAWNRGYLLHVVERAAMVQEIAADAKNLWSGLQDTGHVAVGGIFFDTGLAVLKAESGKALAEISKLMAQQPSLKVHVVGHTDNVGGWSANMKLSKDRADAVVRALGDTYKVDGNRLAASGVGPLAPVASNHAEEGRAKNRRVELVEQ